MAASLSDENSAPVDFQISSTIGDDEDSKSSLLREKCLLCFNPKKVFYCKDCVRNGDFVSSTSKYPERFAEKKLYYLKLKGENNLIKSKCVKIIERKKKRNNLELEISQCRERIQLLSKFTKEIKDNNNEHLKLIESIKEKNTSRRNRFPKYKERVEKMRLHVCNTLLDDLQDKRNKLIDITIRLKALKQKNIKDLVYYIFPITRITNRKQEEEFDISDTVCKLAEATRTSYIRGKWIYLDTNLESSLQIVAPKLQENGDYSAYSNWLESHKDGVLDDDKIENNPAYNISAALCYTAQLVNLLAFYLDVILPKRISYSDFCDIEMNEKKFYRRVMRLNMNVLFLCMSQKIDTTLLNPSHTLNNIVCLLKNELGISGPFEIDHDLIVSLENKYENDLNDEEGSEDDENDLFPYEWEAIPLIPCPESTPGPAFSSQMGSVHSTSVAVGMGGLYTSLASMWRGLTGK